MGMQTSRIVNSPGEIHVVIFPGQVLLYNHFPVRNSTVKEI